MSKLVKKPKNSREVSKRLKRKVSKKKSTHNLQKLSNTIQPSGPGTQKEAGWRGNKMVKVGFSSMQGLRSEMEDAHNIVFNCDKKIPGTMFFAVYDGHGGQETSNFLKKEMLSGIKATEEYATGVYDEAIISACLQIDNKINEMFKDRDQVPGSTANMAFIVDKELFVSNIGDSRCVGCIDGEAVALSVDHKPDVPVEQARIVNAGARVDVEDGHLYSKYGILGLSRAIGDSEFKRNEHLEPTEQIVSPLPDVIIRTIDHSWQFMVLACDGVWDVASNEEVVRFVLEGIAKGQNPKEICMALCDKCIGSRDNITCILVCFLQKKTYSELAVKCKSILKSKYRKTK